MVQKKLPLINSAHGSETRNIINELIKLFNGMGYTYNESLQKAQDILEEAQQTNDMNESVQQQINTLIAESGTSDAEVLQARFDAEGNEYPLLKDRLDKADSQLAQTENEIAWISVENFPFQTPETDDTDRINRAVSSITKGTVLIPDGIYNISGDGITVPNGINLEMSSEAEFVYTGNSTCLTLSHGQNRKHVITKIRKSSTEWKDGTDTSSVGLRLLNMDWSSITVLQILGFHSGLQIYGDGEGTCYNTILLGQITNNKLGIDFKEINTGWVNGNMFYGGAIRINSEIAGVTGSKLIDLSKTGNGNTFVGVNLEGESQDKTVVITASHNTFLNCRFEANPTEGFHMLPTTHNNQIIGGYSNYGFNSKIFKDEGVGNFILGGRGLKLYGDNGAYGGDALVLQGLTSGDDILFKGQNFQKRIFSELGASGKLSFYSGIGKYDEITNPSGQQSSIIRINPVTRAIETGKTDGTETPTPLFSVYNADRVNLRKTIYNNGGRFASDLVLLTQNSTTPDVSTSNVFKTNNTVATTITGLGGGSTGQEIIIIGNDEFTTVRHSSAIKLQDSVDLTLKPNDVIRLIKLDGTGSWVETSRSIK